MPTLQNWTRAGLSNTSVHYRVCGGSQCIPLIQPCVAGAAARLLGWLVMVRMSSLGSAIKGQKVPLFPSATATHKDTHTRARGD